MVTDVGFGLLTSKPVINPLAVSKLKV